MLPGSRFIPYLAFERNSGYGNGIDTWLQGGTNEYALPRLLRDSTNNYRGGVRIELRRFHATLEQGGTTFKDDSSINWSGENFGDRTTPLLGQTLELTSLSQAYGIRGKSIYSKALPDGKSDIVAGPERAVPVQPAEDHGQLHGTRHPATSRRFPTCCSTARTTASPTVRRFNRT